MTNMRANGKFSKMDGWTGNMSSHISLRSSTIFQILHFECVPGGQRWIAYIHTIDTRARTRIHFSFLFLSFFASSASTIGMAGMAWHVVCRVGMLSCTTLAHSNACGAFLPRPSNKRKWHCANKFTSISINLFICFTFTSHRHRHTMGRMGSIFQAIRNQLKSNLFVRRFFARQFSQFGQWAYVIHYAFANDALFLFPVRLKMQSAVLPPLKFNM